jgi:hypothetical protein
MIKLTFPMHDWFSQDLTDAVGVFLDYDEAYSHLYTWQLKRWAYTPNTVSRMYRKTLVIEEDDKPIRIVEWHCRQTLEEILSELIYEKEETL